MSGFYKEIQKRFGEGVENYIMASRCAQGLADYAHSTEEEKRDIITRWNELKIGRSVEKEKSTEVVESENVDPYSFGKFDQSSSKHGKDARELQKAAERANRRQAFKDLFRSIDPRTTSRTDRQFATSPIPATYEDAIQSSVHATSTGNAEEDEMIERALRASLLELQAAQAAGAEEDDAYKRAIDASVREAETYIHERRDPDTKDSPDHKTGHRQPPGYTTLPPTNTESTGEHDSNFQRVLEESRLTYQNEESRAKREEEDLERVMEYVKQQSLAEIELERRRSRTGQKSNPDKSTSS
jgi:hypothetical protein